MFTIGTAGHIDGGDNLPNAVKPMLLSTFCWRDDGLDSSMPMPIILRCQPNLLKTEYILG